MERVRAFSTRKVQRLGVRLLVEQGEKRVIFRIGDRSYTTKVSKVEDNAYRVKIDDREHTVMILDGSTSEELTLLLDRVPYRARIVSVTAEGYVLSINGESLRVLMEDRLRIGKRLVAPSLGEKRNDSAVTTRMPGKVISIKVKAGQNIAEGDPLLVLESMKMYVTVKSHRTGVVREVKVKEGGTVSPGETMVVVD